MTGKLLFAILFATATAAVFAQSGRVRPAETPTPAATPKRIGVYEPTEKTPPATAPTATPTPVSADDSDTIKINAGLVPIPVSVFDARGRAITDLGLADFQLRINGVDAEIGEISRAEAPVRLALLFDNSSSVTIAREFEKKAAIRFFRRVIRPEKDRVALFSVSTVARLEQPFTTDIPSLVSAIEGFAQPEGATALLDGIVEAARYLGESSGRRVIVIVSDGDDTISDSTFEETIKALQMSNVQVFVVKTTDFENLKRTGQRRGSENLRQLSAERRMQEIAKQTGGVVWSPLEEDELDAAFEQISAELSQQYVISYYPEPEPDKRGEFRSISVTVKNRPATTIRTRKGYYVPKK
jgi:Ca-activated chloride channel family protein